MKIHKLLPLVSFLAPLSLFSCANYQKSTELSNLIDSSSNVLQNDQSEKEKMTKFVLDSILNKQFKNSQVNRVAFINSQNNEANITAFLEKSQQYSQIILNSNESDQIEEAKINLKNLYNKNWLILLNHLNKLHIHFDNWYYFQDYNSDLKNSAHSQEFKDKIEHSLNFPRPWTEEYKTELFLNPDAKPKFEVFYDTKIKNLFLDEIIEGEESAEMPNTTIFYVLKDKLLFRIKVNNENVEIQNIIYFDKSKSKISLNLISNIVHSGFVHHDQEGYDRLEEDIVNKYRYNIPSEVLLINKGERNEN
ncbi:hypothetical protein VO56_02775 [Mycoplasmopsis gallinacea]|uniref:Lipoprotein n=1 Tax=Mycoplasmopsis gallinacea TaxID=29556 RepID=A0A0D5ZK24_9BACT|nr:hypothetical protein VO56_02775 [Mycoplasmopsis gallinacea]